MSFVMICRDRHSSRDRDDRRDDRRGEWEGTPLRRGGEEEWEMTPSRDRGRSATPSGRPFTGASEWDLSASPALEPVRAGSKGKYPMHSSPPFPSATPNILLCSHARPLLPQT